MNVPKSEQICGVCGSTEKVCKLYGGLCCVACKSFFIYSVVEEKAYVCRKKGQCPINKETRTICQHCRYNACLKAGMQPSQLTLNKHTCAICGSKKRVYRFYGAISCINCKKFFRDTTQNDKSDKLKCRKAGKCDINEETRRNCQYCRYNACLNAGMQPSLLTSSVSISESCAVCGCYNEVYKLYDGLASICLCCSLFFRRSIRTYWKDFKCNKDESCDINIKTRASCRYCRLQRCFDNGMNPKLVKSKTEEDIKYCKICGSSVDVYKNNETLTCKACYHFFKLTIETLSWPRFTCDNEGKCEINESNRNNCKKCRYESCVSFNMRIRTSKTLLKECGVCGSKSNVYNHKNGTLCRACQIFFNRVNQNDKWKALKCDKNEDCEISYMNPKVFCKFCRHKRCLTVDMNHSKADDTQQKPSNAQPPHTNIYDQDFMDDNNPTNEDQS